MARLCRVEGRWGSWVCREAAGGAAGRILEAELVKDRDLAQLGTDVLMNAMGKFRVVLLDQQYPCLESLR